MQHGKHPKSSTSRYWDDVMSIPGPPRSTGPPPSSAPPVGSASGSASSALPLAAAAAPYYLPPPQFPAQLQPPAPNAAKPPKPSGSSSRARAGRQFKCDVCNSLFERRGHLEAHVETVHEGKRPHRCPHNCGKVFGHRSSLSRHVKSSHQNPTTPSASKSKSKKHHGP